MVGVRFRLRDRIRVRVMVGVRVRFRLRDRIRVRVMVWVRFILRVRVRVRVMVGVRVRLGVRVRVRVRDQSPGRTSFQLSVHGLLIALSDSFEVLVCVIRAVGQVPSISGPPSK